MLNGNGKSAALMGGIVIVFLGLVLVNNSKPTREEMEQKDAALEMRITTRLDRMERKLDYLVEQERGSTWRDRRGN